MLLRTQRAKMRSIFERNNGNSARTVSEYAEAERRGEVRRKKNGAMLSPEAYAAALLNDGIKKGWLTAVSRAKTAVPLRGDDNGRILEILGQAKKLAQEYHLLTAKPLGITGEIAEFEASRILGVALTPARQAGYDAIEMKGRGQWRLQIKGRRLPPNAGPGQRLGSIQTEKEWDAIMMVLLDENFDAFEIWEAERQVVVHAIKSPGSKARNERGALTVGKIKSIGKLRWRRPSKHDLDAHIIRQEILFCDACSKAALRHWKGWPHKNAIPSLPRIQSGNCGKCGGAREMASSRVSWRAYHHEFNTGLPDYWYLAVGAGNEKFGYPYFAEAACPRCGNPAVISEMNFPNGDHELMINCEKCGCVPRGSGSAGGRSNNAI